MELVCPECLGTLIPKDASTLRCRTHGGEYKVLFNRYLHAQPVAAEIPPAETPIAPPLLGSGCSRHPAVAPTFICRSCGKPICVTCAFREPDGTALCPDCVSLSGSGMSVSTVPSFADPELAPPLAGQRTCVQHPNVPAVRQCKLCGAYMCATCDFALPGGIHICPTCAAKPQQGLSPRRKKLLIGGLALAAWSTVGLGCLFCGVFAGLAHKNGEEEALGMVLMIFVLFPAIAGLGVSLSARDKRLANPPWILIAIIWNAVLVGSFLLLCIVGLLMKG